MTTLLHLNDNQLVLQFPDGRSAQSQGYAWLKSDQVRFDIHSGQTAAVQQCRLNPQEINNRYWQYCDQSSIAANSLGLRHAADLVWQHLSQLKAENALDEVVMLVPSHYQESQLQMLLGVSQACDISVQAIVNKAVAELSKHSLVDGVYRHVDVQLHQSVCSTVTVLNGHCVLSDVQIFQEVGIHLMQEALLHGLQNIFIQDDRFDPLHDAATEQQLFNQLAAISQSLLSSGKANIGVEHQSRLHSVSIESTTWDSLLAPFTNIISGMSGAVLKTYVDLNSAFGSSTLNGLSSTEFIGVEPKQKNPTIAKDVSRFLAHSKEGDVVLYQTKLAMLNQSQKQTHIDQRNVDQGRVSELKNQSAVLDKKSTNQPTSMTEKSIATSATHVLVSGEAVPIESAYVTFESHGMSLQKKNQGNFLSLLEHKKLFIINDEQRQQTKPNDRVGSHLSDGMLTLIQVL